MCYLFMYLCIYG
uniref:Uncharacterized protein n=1 Tax=Anguilla anguilla TaxID=7936 RepID=A0A0E9U765_ANGAN